MNSKRPRTIKTDLKAPEQPKLDLRQEEDFTVRYANHVAIAPTGFDVKVTFGRIDLSLGPNVVVQNMAIVLPWAAVKTLIYLLHSGLVAYEEINGHVPYPVGGIIPPGRSLSAEVASLPNSKRAHEKVLKIWDDFLAANPEVSPDR